MIVFKKEPISCHSQQWSHRGTLERYPSGWLLSSAFGREPHSFESQPQHSNQSESRTGVDSSGVSGVRLDDVGGLRISRTGGARWVVAQTAMIGRWMGADEKEICDAMTGAALVQPASFPANQPLSNLATGQSLLCRPFRNDG